MISTCPRATPDTQQLQKACASISISIIPQHSQLQRNMQPSLSSPHHDLHCILVLHRLCIVLSCLQHLVTFGRCDDVSVSSIVDKQAALG